MMVKICGITRREDAETAAREGASAIGFVFYPTSPRYVEPAAAAEMGQGLDVWKVGIFVNETSASVDAVMRAACLDVAQIYGGEAPRGVRVWRAFRMPLPAKDLLAQDLLEHDAEAVLLDGLANGVTFNWLLARNSAAKLIVAGGLDASNVAEAIRVARPWGVDASSSLETAPGVKDHAKMRAFIQAAREAQ